MCSNSARELGNAKEFLRGILRSLASGECGPTGVQVNNIQNSLATILEVQGTVATLQEAVEIRMKLPREYNLDLAYTLLRLSTFTLNSRHIRRDKPPPFVSTRSGMVANTDKQLELARCLANLANHFYDLNICDDASTIAEKSVELFRELRGPVTDPLDLCITRLPREHPCEPSTVHDRCIPIG